MDLHQVHIGSLVLPGSKLELGPHEFAMDLNFGRVTVHFTVKLEECQRVEYCIAVPCIILSCTTNAGVRIRKTFQLQSSGPYFDPDSSRDWEKKIVLVLKRISPQEQTVLHAKLATSSIPTVQLSEYEAKEALIKWHTLVKRFKPAPARCRQLHIGTLVMRVDECLEFSESSFKLQNIKGSPVVLPDKRFFVTIKECRGIEYCMKGDLPSIVVSCTADAGTRIRNLFKMKPAGPYCHSRPYYDPDSQNDAENKIIFILEKLGTTKEEHSWEKLMDSLERDHVNVKPLSAMDMKKCLIKAHCLVKSLYFKQVHIGSMVLASAGNMEIAEETLTFCVSFGTQKVKHEMKISDIKSASCCLEGSYPALILHCSSAYGKHVQKMYSMKPADRVYFDPDSSDDKVNRFSIILYEVTDQKGLEKTITEAFERSPGGCKVEFLCEEKMKCLQKKLEILVVKKRKLSTCPVLPAKIPHHDVHLDPCVHMYLSSEGWLCILKPDHVPLRPCLLPTSWNQFVRTLDPNKVVCFCICNVSLDLCMRDVIFFAKKCDKLRRFVNYNTVSTPVDKYSKSLICEVISGGKALREIDIRDNDLEGYHGWKVMKLLAETTQLEAVTFSRTKLGIQNVPAHCLTGLFWLDLTECGLSPTSLDNTLSQISQNCHRLVALIIDGNVVESREKLPDYISELKKLQLLSAANCELQKDVLLEIVSRVSKEVEVLAVHGNQPFGDGGVSLGDEIKKLPRLLFLRISPNQLSSPDNDRISGLMQEKGGSLFMGIEGSRGWDEYIASFTKIRCIFDES